LKIVMSVVLGFAVVSLSCSLSWATEPSKVQQPEPSSKAVEGATSATGSVRGTVLESLDAAGYTYMRLKTANGEIWAAVQKATVKKGSQVTVVDAIPMDGFESKTLKRKFDRIVFGYLGAMSPSPMAPAHGTPTNAQAQASAQAPKGAKSAPDTGTIKVKKAEGAEGKTISEIFAQKTSLKDVSVAVRGKVVKYNPGIMGKNWIHLRDGSGSSEKKDNDITVTTVDAAAVGNVVLVKGKLHLDRDFGSGYFYPLIIEDGKVYK
jgi:hypothetical protein